MFEYSLSICRYCFNDMMTEAKVLVWLELFPPPPDEIGFKRGLNTSFNTNIC